MQIAIVAAGFTPGEADALRRAMAAWKRSGGLDAFRERAARRACMTAGYPRRVRRSAIFQQIRASANTASPKRMRLSFALLVYDSAWLKCHEPAAFTCALLNSQPMGFYAPAQLVRDARAHGVEVRPVDVCVSLWDSTLERRADGEPALRLGLRLVKVAVAHRGRMADRGAHARAPSAACRTSPRAPGSIAAISRPSPPRGHSPL